MRSVSSIHHASHRWSQILGSKQLLLDQFERSPVGNVAARVSFLPQTWQTPDVVSMTPSLQPVAMVSQARFLGETLPNQGETSLATYFWLLRYPVCPGQDLVCSSQAAETTRITYFDYWYQLEVEVKHEMRTDRLQSREMFSGARLSIS